jgi:histone H3/H4
MIKKKHHIPWLNRSLKRMFRRKARLHKHAKRTGNLKEYRHFQKECKRQFRKAEWDHINNIISEGVENNNSKPFWNYMKSKKQDNIGVAPLKRSGGLTNESKEKAEILSNQFKSVFTKPKPNISTTVLQCTTRAGSTMQNLKITVEGVEKLLKNTNPSKAMGPDRIQNIILKTCAEELAPCLRNIFQKSVDCGTLPND